MQWITDDNGNRCSVEYFGSDEAARKALESLIDCKNCIDCSRCSHCSHCSHCSYCSGCSYCSRCSYCSGCSHCSHCSGKHHSRDQSPPSIPVIENIHQKIFAAASAPKALDMGAWHTCKTTHCRAGWVVHLAGKAGYALERFHNPLLAAQLIYRASGYDIHPGRFYDSDADALADMRRLAEGQ